MAYVGKNYNPEIWSDMTYEEKQTYAIYEAFQKEYNKLVAKNKLPARKWLPQADRKTVTDYERDGKYPADFIREHDNWTIFVDIYEKYKHMDIFNAEMFVKGAFYYRDRLKKIFPRMLLSKECENSYYQYIEKLMVEAKSGGTDEEILSGLRGTRMSICRLLGIPSTQMPDYEDIYNLFNKAPKGAILSKGVVYATTGLFSLYYLAISRSFNAAYETLDPDVRAEIGFDTKDDMGLYIGTVHQFPKAYKGAKFLFGEDIY